MKLLILFGLFAAAVASSLPDQRILVGKETDISEIPWQVSIQFLGHACSGSVIAPQWVLTAASCVVGLSEKLTQIRYGSSLHNNGGSLARIEKIVINPGYDRTTYASDIALIKTIDVLNTLPVVLANQGENLFTGVPVTISGWGITSLEHGQFAEKLQSTTVRFIFEGSCRAYYGDSTNINLPTNVFCAGDPQNGGASICRGDIGGPATFKEEADPTSIRKLYGISSFTVSCGGIGQPSVFTSVMPYRTWIKENAGV